MRYLRFLGLQLPPKSRTSFDYTDEMSVASHRSVTSAVVAQFSVSNMFMGDHQ